MTYLAAERGVYASVDVLIRLLCGSCFFITALMHETWLFAFIQIVITCGLIRYLDGNWIRLIRSWKLLRWFFIPILLLHAFFTPGIGIWPGSHVSVEGLERGGWLVFRLMMIFISALVLINILTQKEWLRLLTRMPVFGRDIWPYLLLLSPLYHESKALICISWKQWRQNQRKWHVLGDVLTTMIQDILDQSQMTAKRLWENWDQEINQYAQPPSKRINAHLSMALITATIIWVFLSMAGL
ncbi:MAG: energy-coupling factor transporter transmembrane component T [Mariprofundaceae bacterium]